MLSVVTYSKILNPMIFMTKEYFLSRVHEEEMFIVQELVEMVEEWRYCKRLALRHRHEEIKKQARKLEGNRYGSSMIVKNSVMSSIGTKSTNAALEPLIRKVKEQIETDISLLKSEDPYGT